MSRSGRSFNPSGGGALAWDFDRRKAIPPSRNRVSGKPAMSCRPRSEVQRHNFAILQLPPGQTIEESAVAHHRDDALRALRKPVAEKLNAVGQHLIRLDHDATLIRLAVAMPPDLLEMIEGQRGKFAPQQARRAADVTTTVQPLAVEALDLDLRRGRVVGKQPEGRLDRPRKRRGDHQLVGYG